MPPRLFKKLGYICVVTCASVGAMVYYSLTIIWPTMVSTLFTSDVMQVGWKSCVVGGGILLGQVIGGTYLAYGPKVKWMMVFGSAAGGAFTASLAAATPDGESAAIAQAILALVFIGIVEGLSFPGVTLLFEDQDIGVAAGVLGSIRGMAGAIAQALYVSILTNKSSQYLARFVPPAATGAGLSADAVPAVFDGLTTGSFDAVPGITPSIIAAVGAAVQRAYTNAFYWTFIAAIPFGKHSSQYVRIELWLTQSSRYHPLHRLPWRAELGEIQHAERGQEAAGTRHQAGGRRGRRGEGLKCIRVVPQLSSAGILVHTL